MHTLFVSGVFNVTAHLFTKALKTLRPPGGYQTYRDYLQPWEWPKTKASTATMRNVCNVKRTKSNNEAHKMKGSASELLSIYPILAHLVQHEYLEKGVLQDEAIALIRLAEIVDLLILVPRGTVDPFNFMLLSLNSWGQLWQHLVRIVLHSTSCNIYLNNYMLAVH